MNFDELRKTREWLSGPMPPDSLRIQIVKENGQFSSGSTLEMDSLSARDMICLLTVLHGVYKAVAQSFIGQIAEDLGWPADLVAQHVANMVKGAPARDCTAIFIDKEDGQ